MQDVKEKDKWMMEMKRSVYKSNIDSSFLRRQVPAMMLAMVW